MRWNKIISIEKLSFVIKEWGIYGIFDCINKSSNRIEGFLGENPLEEDFKANPNFFYLHFLFDFFLLISLVREVGQKWMIFILIKKNFIKN